MVNYILFDANGEITEHGYRHYEGDVTILPNHVITDGTIYPESHFVENGIPQAYSPSHAALKANKPHPDAKWSNASKSWIDSRSLPQQRLDQWGLIKSSRNAALTAPLTTVYGVFDADVYSQKNITDAISMLQTLSDAGYPQTIEYTLYDNTVAVLSTAQMVEVGLALGQRTQQVYATSRTLRTAIDAATTISEIESITWPT